MRKTAFLITLIILTFGLKSLSEDNYNVFYPMTYGYTQGNDECVLFILDYSNSMNEGVKGVKGVRKSDILKYAFYKVLNQIPKNEKVGLRVYGHKRSILTAQACRASENLSAIRQNSCSDIAKIMEKLKPSGMTPITYSLKQAVMNDFKECSGLKHIILITDGGENCDESPCEYAIRLVKENQDIKIDVIAVDMDNKDDLSQLECVAYVTNGRIFRANSVEEVEAKIINALNAAKEVEGRIIMK